VGKKNAKDAKVAPRPQWVSLFSVGGSMWSMTMTSMGALVDSSFRLGIAEAGAGSGMQGGMRADWLRATGAVTAIDTAIRSNGLGVKFNLGLLIGEWILRAFLSWRLSSPTAARCGR